MLFNGLALTATKTGKGDCIHLRFNGYNLIVDSGPASAAGEFRKLCESILSSGENLDALILTHYDEDHIGGILKTGDLGFRNIYFNAYDGKEENGNLSAGQNQRLFHLLPNTVVHPSVVAGNVIEVGNALITVQAPTQEALFSAKTKMQEADALLAAVSDWGTSFDELMERPYPSRDASVSNQASIVFTLEYKNSKILFTGDAWSDSIPAGEFDLVKLPHHGSARNISDNIISSLNTNSFLICADGSSHPSKQTIAKLIKLKDRVTVFSNYDWWMKGFLLPDDMKYINCRKLEFKLI